MVPQSNNQPVKTSKSYGAAEPYRLLFFSELIKLPVCAQKVNNRLGKLTDLVFRLADPYPEAVGIYLEHGWGRPTEFIPWEKVIKIDDDAILVAKPEEGEGYLPFKDQPGWILVNDHLMGRTILDMDGRTIEVVNDVHLLESKGRMLVVHVDISFNGFLRKWGLGKVSWLKDHLISWRYVQPLSLEDAGVTDAVSLSVTRKQVKELPSEDLADALEELSGEEQQAFFSALDAEKAAETLVAAEPRTQRQLVADLRKEKARTILAQMSVPQLADLFSVLPHDDMVKMIDLLPKEDADRITAIISEHETTARTLMSDAFVAAARETTVAAILSQIRASQTDPETVSYIYIVGSEDQFLVGVVDLRELVLAPDDTPLGNIMVAPVVSAQEDDTRETLEELFVKYHFRMIPVVDARDRLIGIIRYNDIMTGLVILAKR
jgi:CBS domain-containing protein/uncharacterized protein YrrD